MGVRHDYFGPVIPRYDTQKEIQRRNAFRRLIVKGTPSLEAAIKAGYSKRTALSKHEIMASRALASLKGEAEKQGIERRGLIQWLKDALVAKTPKWNSYTKSWDLFDNFDAQLAAWDRLRAIIEPKPPEEININVRRGVDAPPEETYEAWLQRTTRERAERAAGQLLLAPSTGPTNGRHTGEGDSE